MPAADGRRIRRRVDGVLLVDKPLGRSSNAVLQHAKHLFAAAKAGHTGTLDPLATGLLPLCFGDATKFAQSLLDARKAYVATVRLGIATTTGDAEGEVIAEGPATASRADLEHVLPRFVGTILQVPPRHAALKFQGRNYYEYARAGIDVPRAPRAVEIYGVDVIAWAPPTATIAVACGKGTYIRVLAEDLGLALGTCAHLTALRRTRTGPFALDAAVTLESLEELDLAARDRLLLPVDAPVADMRRLDVDGRTAAALVQGRSEPAPGAGTGRYRCYGDAGRFLGIVEVGEGRLRAIRLVRTACGAS